MGLFSKLESSKSFAQFASPFLQTPGIVVFHSLQPTNRPSRGRFLAHRHHRHHYNDVLSSITRPKTEMIMADHCLDRRAKPGRHKSESSSRHGFLLQAPKEQKLAQCAAADEAFPGLSTEMVRSRPTLLSTLARASPSSSLIYGMQVETPGPRPFPSGRTRSVAERVVEAIKHEQVRDEEKKGSIIDAVFGHSRMDF